MVLADAAETPTVRCPGIAMIAAAVLIAGAGLSTVTNAAASPSAKQSGPSPTAPPVVSIDLHLPAHPSAADLARVQKVVAGLTSAAQAAAARVQRQADRQAYLGVALDQARAIAAQAQNSLDDAVRRTYESGGGSQVFGFLAGISPADTQAEHLASTATLQVASSLVADREKAGQGVATLTSQAAAARTSLLAAAAPVEAAEGQAEAALDVATQAFASDQAALVALAAQRAALAATSQQVAFAVTPAVSATGRAAAAAQAPLLALLDSTPVGAIPAGYHQTGKLITGISSWYGPGFVGRGTSSGSPYDPEQLTCAMLAVPLGTLVRVSTAAGGVVTVLVTDHGPYAGVDRIIDLSERAAQIAGVGLTPVNVEVLEPN